MKTLNLVNESKSDIQYKISKFPDGQQNIIIAPTYWITDKLTITPVTIKSRLNNWLDLELIVASVASLRELGVEEIHLYTPYIMGARSDRKFEEGGNNYLKDVICPIINSLNFKTVTCIDPHSDVLEACIRGFRKESNLELVKFAIVDLCGFTHGRNPKVDDFILVSPDAGASKKIYKLAEQIGYKSDIITCSKDRDTDGKLTKTIVPYNFKQYNCNTKSCPDIIIIDDICDGGATFINIAKEIRNQLNPIYKTNIYLIVTHGIFSKGFEELSKYFDGIYCTNSYTEIDDVYKEKYKHYKNNNIDIVKQLNVF